MRPLLACTRFRRPRLTHACDRPARRWIAREATAVGESAPTSTPRLVSANRVTSRSSQVGWLKARRSSGHNPASTEVRAVRSPEAHGPFTGGLSSCHRRTEFARRNARRRAAGAGSAVRGRKRRLGGLSTSETLAWARQNPRPNPLMALGLHVRDAPRGVGWVPPLAERATRTAHDRPWIGTKRAPRTSEWIPRSRLARRGP